MCFVCYDKLCHVSLTKIRFEHPAVESLTRHAKLMSSLTCRVMWLQNRDLPILACDLLFHSILLPLLSHVSRLRCCLRTLCHCLVSGMALCVPIRD